MSKKFVIPQIEEEKETKRKQPVYATPYEGSKAKDEHVYPYVSYGNGGKQYQGLDGKKDSDDLEIPYNKNNTNHDEKKYSHDRIPSYYRSETTSGINRSNITDLKGEKLSKEEALEKYRKQYGQVYQTVQEELNVENPLEIKEEKNDTAPQYFHYEEELIDEFSTNKQSSYQNNQNNNQPTYQNNQNNYQPTYQNNQNNYQPSYQNNQNNNQPKYQSNQNNYQNPNVNHYEEEITFEDPTPVTRTRRVEPTRVEPTKVEEVKIEQTRSARPSKDDVNKAASGLKFGDKKKKYIIPPLEILNRNASISDVNTSDVNFQTSAINRTLTDFKVGGKVINYTKGPTVTQFEVKLDPGVNVNKVTGLAKNLQMNLESESIRIEAPIPGKSTIGIEAPNVKKDLVLFGSLVSEPKFLKDNLPLNMILGLSISGQAIYANLGDMPHCLVAGATGGGKTVCIYSMIVSMLYKTSPEEVKMILIDPKRNELIYFESIPHLATPIIDDPKLATASLKWAVDEMERRYDFLKVNRKRTIGDYNNYAVANGLKIIPYIVIVIDEFADLMNTASETFEVNVQRLTQKARSAGIHLIIATQRPSTDVIRGTIKANIPTRIAFSVQTAVDSMTILDHVGAEKLLGKGDMLYTKGNNDIRIQGAYISERELDSLADYFYEQNMECNYIFTHDEIRMNVESNDSSNNEVVEDELLEEIAHFVFRQRKASANQIQTTYEIGFNRANKLINTLATLGIVSSENTPGKAREIAIKDIDTLEEILRNR